MKLRREPTSAACWRSLSTAMLAVLGKTLPMTRSLQKISDYAGSDDKDAEHYEREGSGENDHNRTNRATC